MRRTITTQGGVGGGCNSKHYWLMELLLDRTNNFNLYVKILALGRGVSSFFFIMRKLNCHETLDFYVLPTEIMGM